MKERRKPTKLPVVAPGKAVSRREMLQLLGAGAAWAAAGCMDKPGGTIAATEMSPEANPGVPVSYATSMVVDGFATGLVATARDGRPIKLEGNPDHPASLGGAGVVHQAAILDLYHPGRLRAVTMDGGGDRRTPRPRSWPRFFDWAGTLPRDTRLWLITYPVSSPTFAWLLGAVQDRFPQTRIVYDTPISREPIYRVAERVFGRPADAQYDFGRARVVVSLGADFMATMPMSLRWARQFAGARRSAQGTMNRLYTAGPVPTATTAVADHHLAVASIDIPVLAAALWLSLGPGGSGAGRARDFLARHGLGAHAQAIAAMADDLDQHAGESLVVAGDQQPRETHALAHLLNHRLGAVATTIDYTEPAWLSPLGAPSLVDFVRAARRGQVDAAVILDANPVYTSPRAVDLAAVLGSIPMSVHLCERRDETSTVCKWNLPAAHFLESWGDGRAYDGTVSLVQPLVMPLWGGKTAAQILAGLAGRPDVDGRQLATEFWVDQLGGGDDAGAAWRRALRQGFVPDTARSPLGLPVRDIAAEVVDEVDRSHRHRPAGDLVVEMPPSEVVYDGRFAHNPWLLELPHPTTKLAWDNAALMSPATADRLGVTTENRIELATSRTSLSVPVLVVPDHADDCISLALGFGRSHIEPPFRGVGVNAYPLRDTHEQWSRLGVSVVKQAGTYALARTQHTFDMHGRPIAFSTSLADYIAHPDFTSDHRKEQRSGLDRPDPPAGTPQWGMTIDTAICTGCSSCMVACQAENNIPTVGKRGVLNGRAMHWIRIDTYLEGPRHARRRIHQPMMCQHCEHAPCEYVCPVYATAHSPDGLNEMTYNRCIGTRFCSNNCPYKVRRFNWFEYNAARTARELQFNPDVTVRARGVMEKCTYCVQRIRRAQISANVGRRALGRDEVQTACQQACPTGAIVFGDITDDRATVSAWRTQPRLYSVLHELGTRPRTQYLAQIFNPNPEWDKR